MENATLSLKLELPEVVLHSLEVVCSGALIYRILPPRDESHKLKLKLGHAIVMITAFVVMVVGLQVWSEIILHLL